MAYATWGWNYSKEVRARPDLPGTEESGRVERDRHAHGEVCSRNGGVFQAWRRRTDHTVPFRNANPRSGADSRFDAKWPPADQPGRTYRTRTGCVGVADGWCNRAHCVRIRTADLAAPQGSGP